MKYIDRMANMKKKVLIMLAIVIVTISVLSVILLVMLFKPESIIKFKTVTIFKFEKNVHQNTIVGVLVANTVKPKYFKKEAAFAVGFKKPLFCYFGIGPANNGIPVSVDMNENNMNKIYFSYLIQEKNNFKYDKSLTFVCKQKEEGYYIGYVIPFCIRDGKVYGEMFSSSELYDILTDISEKNNVFLSENGTKTQ